MKKILLITISIVLVLSLFGCDNVILKDTDNVIDTVDTDEKENIQNAVDNTEESVTTDSTDSTDSTEWDNIPYTLELGTIEEYKSFYNEKPKLLWMPYEGIKYLGEFSSFSLLAYVPIDYLKAGHSSIEYVYELNGGQIKVKIKEERMSKDDTKDYAEYLYVTQSSTNTFEGNSLVAVEDGEKGWYELTFSGSSDKSLPNTEQILDNDSIFYFYNPKKTENMYLDSISFVVLRRVKDDGLLAIIVTITAGDEKAGFSNYDFSNEELNKFLYADQAAIALAKFTQRIKHVLQADTADITEECNNQLLPLVDAVVEKETVYERIK